MMNRRQQICLRESSGCPSIVLGKRMVGPADEVNPPGSS